MFNYIDIISIINGFPIVPCRTAKIGVKIQQCNTNVALYYA